MPYKYLDHQADLGICGIGSTPEQALSEGAQAMLSAIADTATIREQEQFAQHCSAPDIPALFVEWLNELLYQQQVNNVLFASARVTEITRDDEGWHLQGIAGGEPLDPERHEIHSEIKAATYSGLAYHHQGDQYVIQCIVDV